MTRLSSIACVIVNDTKVSVHTVNISKKSCDEGGWEVDGR